MNTGTTLLALLVLGGAGYGAYRVINDPVLSTKIRRAIEPPRNRWEIVNEHHEETGKRFIVYEQASPGESVAHNPDGFDSMANARKEIRRRTKSIVDMFKDDPSGDPNDHYVLGVYDAAVGKIVEESSIYANA